MSILDSAICDPAISAPRVILYGSPGVGKTTFAASAGALLIDCEGGAGAIPGLRRTPCLATWREIKLWLQALATEATDAPIAIDTLDWLVHRICEFVCIDLDGKKPNDVTNTIGSAHGGYFKARDVVCNIVHRELLPMLNAIVDRGLPVILLAHAANLKLKTPEGFDIQQAAPDLPAWILPTFVEWSDAVLYARHEAGVRSMQTVGTSLVMAKNRYSFPETLPLEWNAMIDSLAKIETNNTTEKEKQNG